MEVAHRETQSRVDFESATRRAHLNSWRFERILRREEQLAVIDAAGVGRVGRARDDIVPRQNVGVEWRRLDVIRRILLQTDELCGRSKETANPARDDERRNQR